MLQKTRHTLRRGNIRINCVIRGVGGGGGEEFRKGTLLQSDSRSLEIDSEPPLGSVSSIQERRNFHHPHINTATKDISKTHWRAELVISIRPFSSSTPSQSSCAVCLSAVQNLIIDPLRVVVVVELLLEK